MNFLKSNIIKIIIFITIIGLVVFVIKSRSAPAASSLYNPKTDQIVTPTYQPIADTVSLAGSINASNVAILQFQTSGQLAWVGVKIGDHVRRGQAIAMLDKRQLQSQFQTAMNAYLTNRSTFEDTQDQYKATKDNYLVTDPIKRILDRTQWSLDNAVIGVQAADLAVKYATLISPIDGIVVDIDQPNAGVNITPLTANYTIIDPTSIYFKSEIDQETIPKINVGQQATIQLDSFPNSTFNSTITYIAFTPVVNQTSTVYEVRFKLPVDNSTLLYRQGMTGDVSITLSQSPRTLVIPIDAINDDGLGNKYVYTKQANNTLTKVAVTTGIESDTSIEVTKGLTENDQVIIKKR